MPLRLLERGSAFSKASCFSWCSRRGRSASGSPPRLRAGPLDAAAKEIQALLRRSRAASERASGAPSPPPPAPASGLEPRQDGGVVYLGHRVPARTRSRPGQPLDFGGPLGGRRTSSRRVLTARNSPVSRNRSSRVPRRTAGAPRADHRNGPGEERSSRRTGRDPRRPERARIGERIRFMD